MKCLRNGATLNEVLYWKGNAWLQLFKIWPDHEAMLRVLSDILFGAHTLGSFGFAVEHNLKLRGV